MRYLIWVIALTCVSCGSESGNFNRAPTAPTPPAPVVPSCQANTTADVRFGNRSANTTHTIFWDGLNVATLAPGQDSPPRTAAANVAHRWEVRISNSTSLACAIAMPIPSVCSTPTYTCAFP